MADMTPNSGTLERGVNGRYRTFRAEYDYTTGATREVQTGLRNIVNHWVTNETTADQIFDSTVTGGEISLADSSFTNADVITVYAEGW